MPLPTDKRSISSLVSLEALIDSFDEGPDAALEKLEGLNDPTSIRRKLGILSRAKKWDVAAGLLSDIELHESWADLAVAALMCAGLPDKAKRILLWASESSDRFLKARCAIAYADAVWDVTFRGRADGSRIIPGRLSITEAENLKDVIERFEPIYILIEAEQRVSTELDSQALLRLGNFEYVMGNRARTTKIIELLQTRSPIPLRVAEAVLQELVPCPPDLVERLRNEHPKDFQAKVLACILEGRYMSRPEHAFKAAMDLVEMAKSVTERKSLSELLYELGSLVGGETSSEAHKAIQALAGVDSRTLQMIEIDRAFQSGATQEALTRLTAIQDDTDSQWLRLYGHTLQKLGKEEEALTAFKKAANLTADPDLFERIAAISNHLGDVIGTEAALQQLLMLRPNDLRSRQNLAGIYAESSRFKDASEQYLILHQSAPEESKFLANYAISLAHAGNVKESIRILDIACATEPLQLDVILTRAKLLQTQGEEKKAFDSLEVVKSQFWDEPDYLLVYLGIAYASNQESQANDSMQKLIKLSEQGIVDQTQLRAVPFDDIVAMMKEQKELSDKVRQHELEGKFPWHLDAEASNNVPYWSWRLRTQPLDWILEDPLNRAGLTLYATNSFRVLYENSEQGSLLTLAAPAPNTAVVVDISALITLHALGRLEDVATYFGKIYFPATYLARATDEARKLFPHQQSQKLSAELIREAAVRGRITAAKRDQLPQNISLVDEYSEVTDVHTPPYRLIDLLTTLKNIGVLSDAQWQASKSLAHRAPLTTSEEIPPLQGAQSIRIDLTTLQTICGAGLVDLVLREFSVYILDTELDEINSKVNAFSSLEEIRVKHADLWSRLHSDARFVPVPISTSSPKVKDRKQETLDAALSGYLLAEQEMVPLFVDDRVCQSILLNSHKSDSYAAFGTDCALIALHDAGQISDDDLADAFLQLIDWRYKFIVVPPGVLKTLARRFVSNPPGAQLRTVARYVHDCMRDPGLFAGMEPCVPPTSIAVRLFQTWCHTVSNFIVDLWTDKSFPEEAIQSLTTWALAEFLPSPPAVLNQRTQAVLCSLLAKTILSGVLIRSAGSSEYIRLNPALVQIVQNLGLDEDQYLKLVSEVVSASKF